jgi:hypothetical protein
MKEKRGMARFGNTAVPENLIKHGGPLKESTTGIGRPPTQDRRLRIAVADCSFEVTVTFGIGPLQKLP